MENVVGVRFQQAGKIFYFSPSGFEDVEVGEYVVVETSRGLEVARVVISPSQVVNAELSEPLKPINRLADGDDLDQMQALTRQAEDDVAAARRIALRLNLPVRIVSGTYNLDGSRLTIYFNPSGEARVDLRDLLRELQTELRVGVQLRQVGPRDQAKAVGGYGICGRRLCCTTWLTAFPAISIKMAKEQNQPLNPQKISGQCGRLLCCLSYENEMYKQLKSELPRVGTLVSTPAGDARVVGMNALRQVVTLQMSDFSVIEMPAAAMAMDRGVVRVLEMPTTEEPEPGELNGRPLMEPVAARGGNGRRDGGERRGGPPRSEGRRAEPQGQRGPGGPGGPRGEQGPRGEGPGQQSGPGAGPRTQAGGMRPPQPQQGWPGGGPPQQPRAQGSPAQQPQGPSPEAGDGESGEAARRRRRRGGRRRGSGGGGEGPGGGGED